MEQNDKETNNQQEDTILENVESAAEHTSAEATQEETREKSSEVMEESNQPEDFAGQIAALNDKYLRLYSEFDNYRKRTIKEKSDIIRSAGEDVFKAFIPTVDDFDRAIKANEIVEDAAPIKEGMVLIYNKLKSACLHKGLEAMETIGKPFDADFMESIASIPAPSEDMKGKVIDEVEKGYKLGDKVIRFAKVVVGS
jgi:molecular chaperone GrpE